MASLEPSTPGWQFWIDRGGTFTDIVARRPDGLIVTHKLLSDNPGRYADAPLQGIRDVLALDTEAPLEDQPIEAVKMGTTVATNALLERNGERVALVITKGFGDALRIAYQNRPDIFAREIHLPEMLYERVVEVGERMSAEGEELEAVDLAAAEEGLQSAYDAGIRSVAIVFLHAYRYPGHEREVAECARRIGFERVAASHEVSPVMKMVSRGDTTVVDAYLSPLLRRYIDRIAVELGETRLMFMQSNGGLTDAHLFQGKDSILSGPAGGVVGAVRASAMAGLEKIIAFDMGGTSTDVSHYDGEYERAYMTEIAGVRLRAPMMQIKTVAAGGGSILYFDGTRMRVGPRSAGADPGPAGYRRGGPLAVTDANLMVGKIIPELFPKVFGTGGDQPLDGEIVRAKFAELTGVIAQATGEPREPVEIADGYLRIAVENMARAIKEISVQRGYDVSEYALCCFGGAGGQHACMVADALGMKRVVIHPYAGVLSAYGMGLADVRAIHQRALEARFEPALIPEIDALLDELEAVGRAELAHQEVASTRIRVVRKLHMRYLGTDSALEVDYGRPETIVAGFEAAHRQRYGFISPEKPLIVEGVLAEAIGAMAPIEEPIVSERKSGGPKPVRRSRMFSQGGWHETPVFRRDELERGDRLEGPAIIAEANSTTVLEPGWRAEVTALNHLILERHLARAQVQKLGTEVDPVMLEVFNNLFMSIAEQMGRTLENTAHSVNMKERLDFSCALFDSQGQLIANAPHMPVHLGAMGETVRAIITARADAMKPGDVYAHNAPYRGGSHLPDVTVITPVFDAGGEALLFYVASRGHHAEIGGITPGSMPPSSRVVEEEGILFDNVTLVDEGRFREREILDLLTSGPWPSRNPDQNISDLRAQIAANEKGVRELGRMVDHFTLATVQAYMRHVQDNAEECVRRVIDVLQDGRFRFPMDDGSVIEVAITIERARRAARIDFTGTSAQLPGNFNAPSAVCKAAVLYVFRTLVGDEIPLNAGCLKPLEIVIPEGSLLSPAYPAAVVAGNVETSQCITDALYGALGVQAAAQGTMNNFTFGNDRVQYYETIAGGAGAGPDYDGASAVQSHMTNTRMTDPEILEFRYPVIVEVFSIRHGSGGAGKHKGGDGVVRRVRFREAMTAAILSHHRIVAPFGLEGGAAGALGRNAIEKANGEIVELKGQDQAEVEAGDVFVIETPGGGGFGKA
jgi:5-oxoprolinase (ATP-hydrolysing)